ncbi:MAG: hypothetical protein AVDCRST_MAG80-1037 [uncultured Rubrobacteraceae bacterium]|uniref:Uncharacterized protein n=1 Tax=uncultured Rubrobacteraceae bacterium TaxID=349277 RepID=A0A6J4Q8A9_9ACTN|nr:MAG: hypothetical protein AVDCRST_MAG80-1037 [uncultured Rubrobacteraceae bacterium]
MQQDRIPAMIFLSEESSPLASRPSHPTDPVHSVEAVFSRRRSPQRRRGV